VKQKDIAAPIFMIKKLNADLTTITVVEIDAEKKTKRASSLTVKRASSLTIMRMMGRRRPSIGLSW
jgi:hypothetical protein